MVILPNRVNEMSIEEMSTIMHELVIDGYLEEPKEGKIRVKSDFKFEDLKFTDNLKVARLYNFIAYEAPMDKDKFNVVFENGDGEWFTHNYQTKQEVEDLMNN